MSDSPGGSPIRIAVVVLLLVGGGWYFLNNYQIDGLDGVSFHPKGDQSERSDSFVSFSEPPSMLAPNRSVPPENPFSTALTPRVDVRPDVRVSRASQLESIKVASWALDGFGPTKLANHSARKYVSQVIRQFDVVALQQIASIERDLVPRLVELVNAGQLGGNNQPRYDFVMGESTGPSGRQEQMAFVFDTTRVLIDRRKTYAIDDPDLRMTYDPLVASFRAAKPAPSEAWTFTLINLRIDLAQAPAEVALLPTIFDAVRSGGNGEDDVVMLGLFQADDAYLMPTMAAAKNSAAAHRIQAVVRSRPTDVFGRYQTSNLIVDGVTTSEYLGRGGVFQYARAFDLNAIEAEAVTSHLPVYAEFTAHEGGEL